MSMGSITLRGAGCVCVATAGHVIGKDGDDFVHTMIHILDDDNRPLCGWTDDRPEIPGIAPLGFLAATDDYCRQFASDEFIGLCHRCRDSALSRINKGWIALGSQEEGKRVFPSELVFA